MWPAAAQPTIDERWAESRSALVEQLRDEIEAGGPMTFARYMALALYDPADGYYMTSDDRPSRAGDYLSAPELHPIFGATLAAQIEEVWARLDRPATMTLREEAAGSGALIEPLLVALEPAVLEAVRYVPIESSAGREADVRVRVAAAGHGANLADPATTDLPMTGVVIANELLDALPVHRVTMRDGRLQELHVGWRDGWFTEEALPPSIPELQDSLERIGIRLEEGQVGEIGLAAQAWMRLLAERLERGLAVLIDYGHAAADLYDPVRRPGGLLRTYRHHHAGDDAYRFVGEQDITAHVDWTTLERVATDAGLTVLGRTTLAEYLTGLGLGDRLLRWQSRPGVTKDRYIAARAAVVRLLDPQALGGFGVLIVARGIDPQPVLQGLGFRLTRAGY